MKATVVIATKDRRRLALDCAAYVLAQNPPPDEVVVVDNGSSDGTPKALLERFGTRIRLVSEPRPGVWHARNRGIDEARGDVVVFVDDDVQAPPGWLAALLSCFDNPAVAAAGGPTRPLWEVPPPRVLLASKRCLSSLGVTDLGPERRRLDRSEFLIGANCAYRRDWLLRMGGFRRYGRLPGFGGFGEDYELSRLAARQGVAVYEPDAWVGHCMPPRKTRLGHALKRVFYHEAARASHGGRLQPRRGPRELAGWEGVVSATVALGNIFGRFDAGAAARRIARPARRLAWAVRRRLESTPPPRYFELEMVRPCNLRCLHCNIWKNHREPGELELEDWLGLVRQIADWAGPSHLAVGSGETLLDERVLPLVALAQSLHLDVTLVTNATLIDAAMAARLRDSGLSHLAVSLDGAYAETHDLGRGVPGTFKRVMQGLDALERAGLFARTRLAAIISGHNLGELPQIVRLAENRGLAGVCFQPLRPEGRDWKALWPDPSAARNALDELLALKRLGRAVLNEEAHLEAMKLHFTDPSTRHPQVPCRSQRSLLVGHRGEVFACRFSAPIGDTRSASLKEIWASKDARRERERSRRCHESCVLMNCHYQSGKRG